MEDANAPPKVKMSALERLRAKTKHIPGVDGPTKEDLLKAERKKKVASMSWSWKAFIGPKSTDDPDSPYYVPPRPVEEKEDDSMPALALASNLLDRPRSDGESTARSGSSRATSLVWGGRGNSTTRSDKTSASLLKVIKTASVPWGYAAHLKKMYFKRKEDEAAAQPKPVRHAHMLPSEARKLQKSELPRFMRFHAATKSMVKLPSYMTGVKADLPVLEPRKEDSEEEEDDGGDPRRRELIRRAKQREELRRKQAAFTNTSKLKTGKQNLSKRSVQQLRDTRATSTDVYTTLADKNAPLAARRYEEMKEEQRASRAVRRATKAARRTGNTLLQADSFLSGMHKSRTMGMRAYLREKKSERAAEDRVKSAVAIQKAWKGYRARAAWAYVQTLPLHVKTALLRSGEAVGIGGKSPPRGPSREASRPPSRGDALMAGSDLVMPMRPLSPEEAPRRRLRAGPVVPLSGPEFRIGHDALDALRLEASKAMRERYESDRISRRRAKQRRGVA